jgi:methionine sulfoxide reductase heme-binding subunit
LQTRSFHGFTGKSDPDRAKGGDLACGERRERPVRKWLTSAWLWALLAAPGAWLIWSYTTGAITYGAFIHASGDWAVWLLMATLSVTPVRRLLHAGPLALWLARIRRDLGVASFAYAAGHLAAYMLRKADLSLIVREGLEPGLLTGWIAFVILLPLAVTSNDAAVRWLRRGWKRLHILVYPAAILTAAHWVLVAFDPTIAVLHALAIGALLALRLLPARRRS